MSDVRPEWLRPWTLVMGSISTRSATPLQLGERLDRVYAVLKAAGWSVAVKDVAAQTMVGVEPQVKVALYVHRKDKPYSAADALEAVRGAFVVEKLPPVGAWTTELGNAIVYPQAAPAAGGSVVPYVAIAGVLGLLFLFLGKRR